MLNPNMTQSQLMQCINETSFAITDTLLFLDTHPNDTDAINYFNTLNKERKQALALYATQYTPITLDNVDAANCWNWVLDPWPWEGGCN